MDHEAEGSCRSDHLGGCQTNSLALSKTRGREAQSGLQVGVHPPARRFCCLNCQIGGRGDDCKERAGERFGTYQVAVYLVPCRDQRANWANESQPGGAHLHRRLGATGGNMIKRNSRSTVTSSWSGEGCGRPIPTVRNLSEELVKGS
jgi:hypothetical protein